MTFEKIFQNTVLYQNADKGTEGLKHSPEYVLEKSWSEKFHKIHPKETVMKSFFS